MFARILTPKDAIRDVTATWLDSVWHDLRYAVRTLLRRPAVAVAAIGMLALAIGITTAMFTVADALLLRPVPFREPDRLASIWMGNEHGGFTTVSPAVLRAWRDSPAFAAAESAVSDTSLIEVDGTVVARDIARVTPGVFELLGGVRPIRGRVFNASDVRAGIDDRVLVSEDVWRTVYHADPALVGRTISIDREPLVVVGILPSSFRFPKWNTVIWRAVDVDVRARLNAKERPRAYVRFAPDMPRADALRVAMEAARAADAANTGLWPHVQPLAGLVLDPYYQRAVPVLAAGVVLVFFVLCANVTSLLLARMTTRRREFSMRSALGASRRRLIRQAFIESSVLAGTGVVVGLAIAAALISFSRAFLPGAILLRTLHPLNIDLRALAVTSLSGAVATLAAGLLPAWLGTAVNTDETLRVIDRGASETRATRAVTRTLIVGEIALACTLLVGATLLVRSFVNLVNTDRGLDAHDVIVATVTRPPSAARAIEEQLRALPGVQRVAWSYGLPPDGGSFSFGSWRSDVPGAPAVDLVVDRYGVGPDFFALYAIALLRGRTFQPSDPRGHVVIGERLARTLWPGLDPIGRSFTFEQEHFRVIGVVREIHLPTLDARLDRPELYEPFGGNSNYASMSVRCGGSCPDAARVRQRIVAASPGIQVEEVRPVEDAYFEQLAQPRAAAALGFAFAGIAILAAAGGLFSVLSFAVSRRRREFGIRMALGASTRQIRQLVLRDGIIVALTGIGIGMAAAVAVARTLASFEYGVKITDPASWVLVLGVLGGTTIAASWRPARQAARVDPVVLLREE
jgi:putative ABC transport system permease protein